MNDISNPGAHSGDSTLDSTTSAAPGAETSNKSRRRFSRRARIIAVATSVALLASGGVASWAIYNKPELRLVRAIKATTSQKNVDVNFSFQATSAFLRAMNKGKPLLEGSSAPFAGIKTDDDVAKAIGNIHLHLRSSSTDIKNPRMMFALGYGAADVLALTLIDRKLYLHTQAKRLPGQKPALFTDSQFNQAMAALKTPLGPEFADYITKAQADVLRKLLSFAEGQTLFLSFAKGTELGKWWDTTVASPSKNNDTSVSEVQKKVIALAQRIREQLRDVAKVKDLPNDAAGDRMRITFDIASLVKLNKTQIIDILESVSGVGGSDEKFIRAEAVKELDTWLAKPTLSTFSTDVWVNEGRFSRFEFDISEAMAASIEGKPKVEPRGAVVRMDMGDAAVTAPSDAKEFTPADIENAGGLLGGLFLGGLSAGFGS